MASQHVTFARDYDHKWSGRNAYTAFKAGWSGRVLEVVAKGARAVGALEPSSRAKTNNLAETGTVE
jgi:hypothetical protein